MSSCITWYDFPYHMIFDHVLQVNAPIQAVVFVFDKKKNAKEVLNNVVVVIESDESGWYLSY